MSALADLSRDIGVDERTLRRAVAQGTLRGTRPSPRKLELSLSERAYVRRSWPLVAALRTALRTEPNVRFALLFGSAATGEDTSRSDVDVLVELRDPSLERLLALERRLTEHVGRPVELVRLADARRDPVFFALAFEQGRVLVDRSGIGTALRRRAVRLARDEPQREAHRAKAAVARIRRMRAR